MEQFCKAAVGILPWLRDCAGSTVVTFALSLPIVLGSVGLAVDFATYNMLRAELQAAADSGALAAARELALPNVRENTVIGIATNYVQTQFNGSGRAIEIDVKQDKESDSVRVKVMESWVPMFAGVVGAEITPVVVESVAGLSGSTEVCVLTLDPSSGSSFSVTTQSRIVAPDCGLYANSVHAKGMNFSGAGSSTAYVFCTAGGVVHAPGSLSPEPLTDCPPIKNPLADRKAPFSDMPCLEKNLHVKDDIILVPGKYCGGVMIDKSVTVNFQPGTYIVEGGKFQVKGNAKITGKDVGFFLTGNNATIDFSEKSTVQLSGPEEGEMAGLLFFEDPAGMAGKVHRLGSTNIKELTGTVYLPRGKLLVDPSGSVASESAFTAIVVHQLEVKQGPTLVLNSNYKSTAVPFPEDLKAFRGVTLKY